MVRTWSFDRLSVGLNGLELRKVARYARQTSSLTSMGTCSELIIRQSLLREVVTADDEVPTGHLEVRHIASGL